METEKKIEDNMRSALKQALERRQMERLSSNFSYRMMERVRLEAEKQQKRRARTGWIALVISALSLIGMGVYFLFFYWDIRFTDYFSSINLQQGSFLFQFYGAIALLALILLGIDYWLRKKYL